MQSFHAHSKHGNQYRKDPISNSDHSLHGQLRQRDAVVIDHCKRPIHEFHAVRDEQLELSPIKDSKCLESNRNFRNAYNSNVVKRKCMKQGSHEGTYNGAGASAYGRNSCLKRNGNHLNGKEVTLNVAYGDNLNRLCCPDRQDQQLQLELEMKNDSVEGNAEIIKSEAPNGAKGNCNPKKNALTVHFSSGSRGQDEKLNMLSPKCNSKTIASLNTPNPSEGSKSMDLESDEESAVQGCPRRGVVQHPSAAHSKKSMQPKGSGNLSYSEVCQDCLELWRARRLRKNSASDTDKFLKANQQHTAQRSKMSTGGRVRNGRPAAFASSESDEDDSASESSDQFSSVKSSEGLTKQGEERDNKKLEWDPSHPSAIKCGKSTRNMTSEEALMCSVELQPEANTGEVVLQNEQEKLLCHQLSTDCKAQTRPSDTNKANHTVVTSLDNGVPQNISHQGADNEKFNERGKYRLRYQNIKGSETSGTGLAEKINSFCTGPMLLDQNNFATFPKHEILKLNASEFPNHGSGSTTFNRSELDIGAVNKYQKRPVRSCESYCRDFKNWLYGSGYIDVEPETMNCNILRKNQEHSALDTENDMNEKATKEEFHALQTLGVSSYEQIYHDYTLDTAKSGATNRDDGIPHPSIPDLNYLPIMVPDEGSVPSEEPVCEVDEVSFPSEELICEVDEGSVPSKELICQVDECSVPSELICQVDEGSVPSEEPVCQVDEVSFPSEELICEVDEGSVPSNELICLVDECSVPSELICQVATDGSKPHFVTKSLSNSIIVPAIQEEQFKQAEPTQLVEVCDKGTSESAGQMQISDSNTGPPQLSTAAESSRTIDAFKIALCEFIKNILKPLCEDGLLTREVHKIIVKKAVEKVAGTWGPSAPSTEIAISRVLSDESQNLYKLVQV
jgi:hypothetical protein